MRKRIYIILLTTGIILGSVIITLSNRSHNREIVPTESIVLDDKKVLENFPINNNNMKLYLKSQYIEDQTSAGFSLTINDPDNFKNINFAYYIFTLAREKNISLNDDLVQKYKKHFEAYDIDFTTVTLEELQKIAEMSKAINSKKFIHSILNALEEHYCPDKYLYNYKQTEISDKFSYKLSFGATLQVLQIYLTLDIESKHIDAIKKNYTNSIDNYIKETSEDKENYTNLVLLSQFLNYSLRIKNSKLNTWVDSINKKLVTNKDYSFENIYHVYNVTKINSYLNHNQSYVYDYIKYASYYYDEKNIGFNELSASCDIYLLHISKMLNISVKSNDSLCEYINDNLETYFIKRDSIEPNPIYTYYGCMLSKYFNFDISNKKIINTVRTDFYPTILDSRNINNINYIIDTYFTILLANEMDIDFSNLDIKQLEENINKLLMNLDLYDLTLIYKNLYTIQFSLELSKQLSFHIDDQIIGKIKNYLSYLVKNKNCDGSSTLSEVKINYVLLEMNVPGDFNIQFENTLSNLDMNGGFSVTPNEKIGDIITTAKIYRVMECVNSEGLLQFLNRFVKSDYIVPNEDIAQTDLRFYYNFVKLWLIAKGDYKNDYSK